MERSWVEPSVGLNLIIDDRCTDFVLVDPLGIDRVRLEIDNFFLGLESQLKRLIVPVKNFQTVFVICWVSIFIKDFAV